MLAENKKELSLRKGGRGKITEKMRNMKNKKGVGKDEKLAEKTTEREREKTEN